MHWCINQVQREKSKYQNEWEMINLGVYIPLLFAHNKFIHIHLQVMNHLKDGFSNDSNNH